MTHLDETLFDAARTKGKLPKGTTNVSPKQPSIEDTGLHNAASDHDRTGIENWIVLGAHINAINEIGRTPFDVAIAAGPNPVTPQKNTHQQDQMLYEVLQLLVDRGANPKLSPPYIQSKNITSTALRNLEKTTAFLVAAGLDINQTDENTLTPLEHAVIEQKPDAVKLLLRSGADPNYKKQPSEPPVCPLHIAALMHQVDILNILMDAGADPNARNHENQSPLEIALVHAIKPENHRYQQPEHILTEQLLLKKTTPASPQEARRITELAQKIPALQIHVALWLSQHIHKTMLAKSAC